MKVEEQSGHTGPRQVIKSYKQSRLFRACVWFLAISAIPTGILLAVAFASTRQPPFADMWESSTTRQPESFTELYFTDAQKIPATYAANSIVPISFTIRNLENRDVTYQYRLYASDESPRARGEVRVRRGEAIVVPSQIALTGSQQRVKIAVELIEQRQTIHFWLEKRP